MRGFACDIYRHQQKLNPSIPELVANGAALLGWKPMDWTQPCMVGGGREEERSVWSGSKRAREGGGVLSFVKLICWKQPKLCSLEPRSSSSPPPLLSSSSSSSLPAHSFLSSLHLLSVSGELQGTSALCLRQVSLHPSTSKKKKTVLVCNNTPWRCQIKNIHQHLSPLWPKSRMYSPK